uniref:Uncharacterized protein n=1 Tax=Rhizophora mucronata TaxID=61149 RepID=A0A2P2PUT2_RHIMU
MLFTKPIKTEVKCEVKISFFMISQKVKLKG